MRAGQPGAPAQPQAPAAPSARTGVPEDLTKQLDDANKAVEEAARRIDARAAAVGQAAGSGRAGSVSVIKNGAGNVVVTTGDGRVVTIDPRAGLDEDAIQNLVQTALAPPRFPPQPWESRTPVAVVGIVFSSLLLMLVVLLTFRRLGQRAAAGAGAPQLPPDLAPRLARIEQAVEAVAIEVERVSEAQRYSARLLTERLPQPAAPGLGAASPTADIVR